MPDPATPRHTEPPELVDAIRERSVLMGLSYRLLGSLVDAEDETYIRWFRLSEQERRAVTRARAWLVKTASRIGLDMLKTARARRENYVGEWLPEPLPAAGRWSSQRSEDAIDPADRVTLDDSVSMALLVVLESMTPAQRVAFSLHDVFRYTFPEIADIVGRTPAACRQLASSARRRPRLGSARTTPRARRRREVPTRRIRTAARPHHPRRTRQRRTRPRRNRRPRPHPCCPGTRRERRRQDQAGLGDSQPPETGGMGVATITPAPQPMPSVDQDPQKQDDLDATTFAGPRRDVVGVVALLRQLGFHSVCHARAGSGLLCVRASVQQTELCIAFSGRECKFVF